MPFTKPLPHWEAQGIEPPTSLRQNGWKAGIKPPDEYFNYLQNKAYEALKELQEYAVHKEEMDLSGVATKEDLKVVKEDLTKHLAEKATTTGYGHTILNPTVTSTSNDEAATAGAAKIANDNANNRIPKSAINQPNGVPSLDDQGFLLDTQLPKNFSYGIDLMRILTL